MRRLTAFLILVIMLAIVVAPGNAQDNDALPSVSEIVAAEAQGSGGETPEFAVLLAALRAADPSYLRILSDDNSRVTVFAPTDAAFAELIEALGTTQQNLLRDRAVLNSILAYHIVPALYPFESINVMDGAFIGTILEGEALRITLADDGTFVNASMILTPDIFASNGVIHTVDTVLVTPPPFNLRGTGNIASVIQANATAATPEFTKLLAAIQAADPSILATLSGNVPYTLFAPTDLAFENMLEQMETTEEALLADPAQLTTILSYHIVPGEISIDDLIVLGRSMRPDVVPRLTTLTPGITVDVQLDTNRITVNYATVLLPNLEATNGVIHVIDAVLIPPF